MTAAAPFILMCAPNGARRLKRDHPALPLTPEELADCAENVLEAGASILHLHVRDDEGKHCLDAARYREAISAIGDRVGERLVLQVTTEACGIYDPPAQMAVVRELHPEAVSLALREICPVGAPAAEARSFFHWLASAGVRPQYILYDAGDARRLVSLVDDNVIPGGSLFLLFVLGRYAERQAGNPAALPGLLDALGDLPAAWAVCCFGRREDEAARYAARSGGHARVGFENNLHRPDGCPARNNAELVRSAAAHARDAGRPLATAQDVRALFD